MASPNQLYVPVVQRPHAMAAFTEITRLLDEEAGLMDQYDDNYIQGGTALHVPRIGRFNNSFTRPDIFGTITGVLTTTSVNHKDQITPIIYRTLNMPFYTTETQTAYMMTNEKFSAEIDRQIGKEAGLTVISAAYNVLIGALYTVGTAHRYSPATTMSATVIQSGKNLMGDNQQLLKVGFMHSAQYNSLVGSVLNPASPAIVQIFGRVFGEGLGTPTFTRCMDVDWIVDDRIPTTGATTYRAVALRPRATSNVGNAPMYMAVQRNLEIYRQHYTGQQAVRFEIQPQIAFGIGVYGKSYDLTGAGVNPTDATLRTAGSWVDAYADAVASGHKEVSAVLYETLNG